jgi:hypothetical protein
LMTRSSDGLGKSLSLLLAWFWRWWWNRPIRQQWATFLMDGQQRWQAARMSVLQMRMTQPTPGSLAQTMWSCCWKVCVKTVVPTLFGLFWSDFCTVKSVICT